MGRRSRKSKRKLNSMFMALLLTAILLIMSTYAWFTANRVVTINGITAKVTVAEGLQISLDGANWSNSINVNADVLAALGQVPDIQNQNPININNWQWPSELKPVSCDGILNSGLPVFKDGSIDTAGKVLNSISTVAPGYNTGTTVGSGTKLIIFDVYLRNTSGSSGTDTFQLGTGSKVQVTAAKDGNNNSIGVNGTGLEYSSRVGVLLYGNTVSTSAQNQYDICNIGVGTSKFAIWEPNYQLHISDTDAMDDRISGGTDPYLTYAVKNDQVATSISDVTNNADTTNLALVKTTYSTVAELTADINLNDASTGTVNTETQTITNATALTLPRNAVSKAKIYIWLEGQDPDCNDYASAGGGLDFVIKFTKPGPNQGNG